MAKTSKEFYEEFGAEKLAKELKLKRHKVFVDKFGGRDRLFLQFWKQSVKPIALPNRNRFAGPDLHNSSSTIKT